MRVRGVHGWRARWVRTMGANEQVFCRKALGAFKVLRQNAVLIMSLLRLMKDSGIEALAENRESKLQTVEDR